MGKHYNKLLKSNSGNKDAWADSKVKYFEKHIVPQLESQGASNEDAQKAWNGFSKDADKESTVRKPAIKKVATPVDKGLPIRSSETVEKKEPEKSFLSMFAPHKALQAVDGKPNPGLVKAVEWGSQAVVSPELIAKLKGEKQAPQSKEEQDFRATQRGVGKALSKAVTTSTVGKVLSDPSIVRSIPLGQPLAQYLEMRKIEKLSRKKMGTQTKQEILEDKYPYRPEGLVEKGGFGLLSGGIDAVPTYFASKAGLSMPKIMGGMGFLGSFLDVKKKGDSGKDLGFNDFMDIVRGGTQGVAMGKVASTVGKYSEKLSDKVMSGTMKRQAENIASKSWDKVHKQASLKRMDNVVRTGINTAGDTASFGATRMALEGKVPSADDFISDMITSFAIYKGMGKAGRASNTGGVGDNIKASLVKFGIRSQNKKDNKKIFKTVDTIFEKANKKLKSGELDEQTIQEYLQVNLGGLYSKIKGRKSYGSREVMKEEIFKDKKDILKRREYEAVFGKDDNARKSAMDTIKIIAPDRVPDIQRMIDENEVSAKRYGGEYEDPKKIYKNLGDTHVTKAPKELDNIKKERFDNDVSERTEMAIERLVDDLSTNIEMKLKDGKPIGDIELMDGYDYDATHLKNLNVPQKRSAEARTLEILKDKYGLGDILKDERNYLRELKRFLVENEKVWNKTGNTPDDVPKSDLLSKADFEKLRSVAMKDKALIPTDRKALIDELRRRVRKEEPKLLDGEEIESRTAVKSALKSFGKPTFDKAINDFVKPKDANDKIDVHRKKTITKTNEKAVKALIGDKAVDKIKEEETIYSLPIYESNGKTMMGEFAKTGDAFNPKGSKYLIKRLHGELQHRLEQASRVFEHKVSEEYRKLIYDPIIESRANAQVEIKAKQDEFAKILKPLNKASRKRIATHLYSEQPDAKITLDRMGVDAISEKQLSSKEVEVVKFIRKEMKGYIDRVNLSRVASGKAPVDATEGYFTIVRRLDKFIKDGGDPLMADQKMWNNDTSMQETTKLNSGIKRVKGAEVIDLSLDLKNVMNSYINNTLDHIHVSPISSKIRALLKYKKGGDSFEQSNPGLYKYTTKWLDGVVGARDVLLDSPLLDKIARKAITNVSSASLAYNITTVLSQPEALFNTISRHRKYMPGALHDMATMGDFAERHSPQLMTRVMDVTVRDAENAFSKGLQKTVDIGMYSMKKTDAMAAKLHWYASVRKQKANRHKTGHSDHEIYRIASQDMVNSHSSGDMAHIAPIQRNTAGKLFTQFMTFQLNQWYSTKRDVFGIGNKNVSKVEALKQGVMFTILAGLSNTVRESIGMEGMYPSLLTALVKGVYSKDGSVPWQVAGKKRHDPQTVGGTIINMLEEASKIVPLGSSGYGAVASLFNNAYRHGVKRKDYRKFTEQAVKLLGVPGSSMAIRIIRMLERDNDPERERKESTNKKRAEYTRRKLDNTQTRKERRREYARERNKGRRPRR